MTGSSSTPSSTSAEPAPSPEPPKETIVRRGSRRVGLFAAIAVVVVVVIIVVVGFEAGWFGKSSSTPTKLGACPTGVTLLGAGANFIQPIMSNWVSSWDALSGNQLSYNPSGAGAGITALTTKTVDFGATDEPLNSSELAAFTSPVLTLPITAGALAIIYNLPGVTQTLKLNGTTIADIYLGTISTWNNSMIAAQNPGVNLPPNPIIPVYRSDAAGTTYVLTDFLSEDSAQWNHTVGVGISVSWPATPTHGVGQHGNSGVAKYVAATSFTISYVDLADAILYKTTYAQIENPAGQYITPTPADTASAIATIIKSTTLPAASGNWNGVSMVNSHGSADYPLATLAYAFVYQKADQGYFPSGATSVSRVQALVGFLTWVENEGQANATALNYVPLPSQISSIATNGLATMTFNGQSIPACG
jgi:phosphate transport system substrate-binding protein